MDNKKMHRPRDQCDETDRKKMHYFNVKVAVQYGVPAAILLQYLGFWIRVNEINHQNYYDGTFWTFNSRRTLHELMPYFTDQQINTATQKLIKANLIITGNYNKTAYDRTLWYSLTDKGKSILDYQKMDISNKIKGTYKSMKSIPNIDKDDHTNVDTNNNWGTDLDKVF